MTIEWLSRSVEEINRFLFCSWEEARCNATAEELGIDFSESDFNRPDRFGQAFNFKGSNEQTLDAEFWLRDWDLENDEDGGPPRLKRAPAVMNMISDAWMKFALGDDDYRSFLLGTQELPKPGSKLNLQFSSLVAILLVTWVVQLLMPMMLVQLVYEKEENLRIMMKMHGLGDAAYWLVNYSYYLSIYVLYILMFILFGTLADFVIFTSNNYGEISLIGSLKLVCRCSVCISFAVWEYSDFIFVCAQQFLYHNTRLCHFLVLVDLWIWIHRHLPL